MRFKGLSEPPMPKICSAERLEREVGAGFLGRYKIGNPLVEVVAMALSDDEDEYMVLIHTGDETGKFVGTATVKCTWYHALFEELMVLRGAPDDMSSLEKTKCTLFEHGSKRRNEQASLGSLINFDALGLAQKLGFQWMRGQRPVRITEKLLMSLLNNDDEEVRELAKKGLTLIVESLQTRTISPILKRQIGAVCIEIGRRKDLNSEDESNQQEN